MKVGMFSKICFASGLLLLTAYSTSCSSDGGGEKRTRTSSKTTKSENKDTSKCTPPSTTAPSTTPPTTTSTETSSETQEDDDTTPITAGLRLAEVPYSTVSSVIALKCANAGCHAAGGIKPDLSSEALAKESANGFVNRIQSTTSPMPPKSVPTNSQLSVSERDNLVAWAKGVVAATTSTPGTSTSGTPSTTGDTSTPPTTSSTNCTNTSSTDPAPTPSTPPAGDTTDDKEDSLVISAAFKTLMEPAALKTCQTQGKLYDWKNSRCDTAAYTAGVTCNKELVLKSYPNNTTVTAAVASWEEKKWRYNQCGTENSKLVVWMICPSIDGTTCASDEALEAGTQASSATVKYSRLPASGA